jgi:cytoskeletal protein RodZ
MQVKQKSANSAVLPMIAMLLVFMNLGTAQGSTQTLPQNSSQPSTQSQQQSPGVMIDPSAGPLKPSEPSGTQSAPQPAAPPLPEAPRPQSTPAQSSQQPQEPLGAAAAEKITTAGGGASRPAGNAIAPAKQHRYRSLVIKLGAVAAGAVAVGAVYGLSHATSSTPPHSASAATR